MLVGRCYDRSRSTGLLEVLFVEHRLAALGLSPRGSLSVECTFHLPLEPHGDGLEMAIEESIDLQMSARTRLVCLCRRHAEYLSNDHATAVRRQNDTLLP